MNRPLALSATLLLTASALTAGLVGGGAVVANASVIPDADYTPLSLGSANNGAESDEASKTDTEDENASVDGDSNNGDSGSDTGENGSNGSDDGSGSGADDKTCEASDAASQISTAGLDLSKPAAESGNYSVSLTESKNQDRLAIRNKYPANLNGCWFSIKADESSKSSSDLEPIQIQIGKTAKDPDGYPPLTNAAKEPQPSDYPLYYKGTARSVSSSDVELKQDSNGAITFTKADNGGGNTPAPTETSESPGPEPTGGNTPEPSDSSKPPNPGPSSTTSPSDPSGDGDDDNPVPEPTKKPSQTPTQGTGPGDPNNGNGNGASPEQTGGAGDAQGDYSDPVPRGPDASENPDEINDTPDTDGDGWDTGKPTASATSTQAGDGQLTSGLGPLPWSLAAVVGLGALAIVLAFLVLGRRKRKDSE